MKKLIILGYGGTCFDIADAALETKQFELLGFLDDSPKKIEGAEQYPKVLGPLSKFSDFADTYFVNGIGSHLSYVRRPDLLAPFPLNRFVNVIHPAAVVSKTARLGNGLALLSHVSVGANAVIGNHVTVLQNSVIGHDSRIGDFSILAAGVVLSGRVRIGRNVYLGAGSCVKQDLDIGDQALVGLGSGVISNIPAHEVWIGTPAKKMKEL